MFKSRALFWTITVMVLGIQPVWAQSDPNRQLYQITSGRCIVRGGMVPSVQMLPNASEAFIELTIDQQHSVTQMKILGRDMQSVPSVPALSGGNAFSYAFTGGAILSDHIQFGTPGLPMPNQPAFSFVVSNSADALSINGTVQLSLPPGTSDVPNTFLHTNVVAVLMPPVTISRGSSEVEICWPGAIGRSYQVQYRTDFTTNAWTPLGLPTPGSGATNRITDSPPSGSSQRYYRVVIAP